MDSTFTGEFRTENIDGKQYFVFHLNNNSDEASIDSGDTENSSTMFLCPTAQIDSIFEPYTNRSWDDVVILEIDSSPMKYLSNDKYEKERLDFDKHHYVLPLFWCKNYKDYNDDSTYYFCAKCDITYDNDKKRVESPLEIKHPNHPNHTLKLFYFSHHDYCAHCELYRSDMNYHCTQCNLSIDVICAKKSIPLVIDQPKRHNHPLKFFTRKASLDCNVCGLVKQMCSTYVCVECDFVAHQDCAEFPSVIRISRHGHRVSFTSSLSPGKWSCGVCRKNVESGYGVYTCSKCDDGYVVHSRCALRKDIWDGKELEGVPEEDDIEEIVEPFTRISDGIICHFVHKHVMKLETSGEVYDGNKICDACVIPIYEGDFYSCMECDFILHDKCANVPRMIRHPLHPHPLTLKVTSEYNNKGYFRCKACDRDCSDFVYECNNKKDCFKLDIRCSSITEPFDYEGHEHPLFLALDPRKKELCQICLDDDGALINCIECDFIICLTCVNVPCKARYKHDKHFLTLVHKKETTELDWCEICEKSLILADANYCYGKDKKFYECKKCCITLHIDCLLGRPMYLKPGHIIYENVQIVANNSLSRPFCFHCGDRCDTKMFYKTPNSIACSLLHLPP